jgi:hypothetical protein
VYLGAIFSVDDPWFTEQWGKALQQATSRWVLCRRAQVKAHGFPVRACRTMIFAQIIPLVEYAVEALPWNCAELQRCQTLVTNTLRYVMGSDPRESVMVCHSDMNIAPLQIRRQRSILRAFHRFTSGVSTQATQAVVACSIRRAATFLHSGRVRAPPCWGLQLHDSLKRFGLLEFWNPLHPCARIRELDQASWFKLVDDATPSVIYAWRAKEIKAHSHLHSFAIFARERRFASYLYLQNPFLREFVIGLRARSLLVQQCKPSLQHKRSPVLTDDVGSCPFCRAQEPETIEHFLMDCSYFASHRASIPFLPSQQAGCPRVDVVCRDTNSKTALPAGSVPIVSGWYRMWRARLVRLHELEEERATASHSEAPSSPSDSDVLDAMGSTATSAALLALVDVPPDPVLTLPSTSLHHMPFTPLRDDPAEPSDYDA